MTATTMTKQDAVLEALKAGEELTAAQMTKRFGTANPTALVSNLRFKGYAVYGNARKDAKGNTVTKYRLGKPRRAVVAAGYRAIAEGFIIVNDDGSISVNA
jgi:predicted ArsR family transcriptional regulator